MPHPRGGGVISAQPAVALSVDIITPETDPYEIRQYQRRYFEAVCRDAKGNDVTEKAAFSWDFDDGTEPDRDNPALHHWLNTGKYEVTVTATLRDARTTDSQGTDTVTVEVSPGVQTRSAPGAGDFSFDAFPILDWSSTFGSTVCDAVDLICRANDPGTDPYDPWCLLEIEIQRDVDGEWHVFEDEWEMIQIGGEEYEGCVHLWTTFDGFKNIAYTWRTKLVMWDSNYPPDPEFFPDAFAEFYVPGSSGTDWTPDNTIVKATGDDLILHHADDTSHTISWNITHLDYDNPTFTVNVDICSLSGGVRTTLTDENATIGGGSIDWDTDLPEDNGIYTYRITAEHNLTEQQGPPGLCVDTDKSSQLEISNVGFEWITFTPRTQAFAYRLNYDLSGDAAPASLELEVYDRQLQTIHSASLDGYTAGSHSFTDSFTADPAITGPYYFVLYADETNADGENNRDEVPKPAHSTGTVHPVYPRASHWKAQDNWYGPNPEGRLEEETNGTHYSAAVHSAAPNDDLLLDSWDRDGIFYYHNHAMAGQMVIAGPDDHVRHIYAETPPEPLLEGDLVLDDLLDGLYPHIFFAHFKGCRTAKTDPYKGNICEKMWSHLGADVVLGFEGDASGGEATAIWEEVFYGEAIGSIPRKTIKQAVEDAIDAIEKEYGDDCEFDTNEIYGDENAFLDPARYGDL